MDKIEIKISADGTKIYAPLVIKWLKCTPEEKVRQEFICRLVNDYGYSLAQMEQELNLTERSKRGTGAARADIIVWANAEDKGKRKRALFVVECKAPSVSIDKDDVCFQGFNYASWMHSRFFVVTNQNKTRFFKLTEKIVPLFVPDLEEIDNIPNAQQALGYVDRTFSFSVPDGLLPRDKEADNLYNCVIANRFFNLIGVGGSGKSSLAYLMMQKHESDFNEIAYVVVNNKINIKETIVSQFKEYLKIDLKEDDIYKQLVTYLENNFKAAKPNLLVLDINELSDGTKDFAKNIHKLCPNSWQVLILSREYIDPSENITKEDLNQKQDPKFLKELFLKRAGNRYADFDSFDDLFAIVFHNPLLIEQLGFYLSKLPVKKSLEAIKAVLFGPKFKNKDLKGFAVLTNDNRSTMIEFLTNLLPFDTDYLNHNEKELLRHFILWPVDFINYKVIQKLLQGVFESDDDIDEALEKLTDRALLSTQTSDDGSLSYKLHGLLAESLREQIDVSMENYPIYEKNTTNTTSNYTHKKDSINEKVCIYTSFCLWGQKMKDVTKGQYIQVWAHQSLATLLNDTKSILYHFNKSIEIGEQLPINNSEYQYSLADSYYYFASFLVTSLQDFTNAIIQYQNAISVLNPHHSNTNCQRLLAWVYNDYALLLQTYCDKGQSAELLYNKAIKICEFFTKQTNELYLLGLLAITYNNYGMLKQFDYDDIQEAETFYNKSIEIGEEIYKETNNPYLVYSLVLAYNNLGMLQQSHYDDFKSATKNYKTAIEIGDKLKDTKEPVFLNSLALAYSNYGALQLRFPSDFTSAETTIKNAIDIGEFITKNSKDPQFLHTLALAYFNFGYLRDNYCKDFKSAEDYYNKAIEIGVSIKYVNNPQFLNSLLFAYSGLATLQYTYLNDYQAAQKNYKNAIEIVDLLTKHSKDSQTCFILSLTYHNFALLLEEGIFKDYKTAMHFYIKAIEYGKHLPKGNSEYQDHLALYYLNLALLQKDIFKDFSSAKTNFIQAINIREQLPKENHKYQDNLASLYNNLAILLENDCFNDYTAAKENYIKAIEIEGQLPKDNPDYQDHLALYYHNLALLQKDIFKDFSSAKTNFIQAINIREQLPKDNHEYQDNLAQSYNNYTCLLKDDFNDYVSAKEYCNKAIEIAKQLSINNPDKYNIYVYGYKHTLAEIYFDTNDIESAKSILSEIKPLAEQCLANNPDDGWTQSVNNDINDLLEKITHLKA